MDRPVTRSQHEIRTVDGRVLLAESVGPEDGPLVIYHTGTPGTRHCFEGDLANAVARGLRHVCYSRPGYEGSHRRAGRSHADCAADTAAVADALGSERFHVSGCSGGGGPALACAALLPERVISVAAIATFAPRDAEGLDWLAGIEPVNGPENAAIEAGDDVLESCLEELAARFGAIGNRRELLASSEGTLCEADEECLTGAYLEYQLTCCQRVADGGRGGWFDDDKAIWGDWGFDLSEISVPVSLWQGARDGIVPLAHSHWLADHVPGCRFQLLPEDGHLSILPRHYDAILDELVGLGG